MGEWEALQQRCLDCRACSLCQTRTHAVFGVGDPQAEVLFVGEAPGEREDALGEPFVGKAGQLLDDMLTMIGLDRSRIYITNSIKCRPPQNRDPLNTEKEACAPFLQRQLQLMQPKIIVCHLHPHHRPLSAQCYPKYSGRHSGRPVHLLGAGIGRKTAAPNSNRE